jgi:hypothetical protein
MQESLHWKVKSRAQLKSLNNTAMKNPLIKKNYFIVLFGLFLSFNFAFAQERIVYEYDQAGNRIKREKKTIQIRSDVAEESEEPTAIYSEVLGDLEIKIYPNPTDGILFIELLHLPENSLADITLYQLSGSLIDRKESIHFSTEFNLSDQPAGIYILQIIAGDKQTEWKVIKK